MNNRINTVRIMTLNKAVLWLNEPWAGNEIKRNSKPLFSTKNKS